MELVLGDVVRIFRYVFGGLIVAILLGALGWIAREKVILAIASYQLRSDLATIKRLIYKNNAGYNCQTTLGGYQLRFISETEYIIESVCDGVGESVIQSGRLPLGARRLYGSGVLIEIVDGIPIFKDSWVHLVNGETQTVVGLFDAIPKVLWEIQDLGIGGESPANARCTDWGFSCCQTGVEAGELFQVRTYDCVHNCYQHCNKLPLILYFNTYPVLNEKTREVVVPKADSVVSFGYSVSDDEEGLELEIDFGDGKVSRRLPAYQEDLQHEYKCMANTCLYQVVMRGRDKSGNGLVDSGLNKMLVIVR